MKIDLNTFLGIAVKGRYVLQERVGEGGMGVVFRALDRKKMCDVAVKVLCPRDAWDNFKVERYRIFRKRFIQEAKIMRIKHPHIMPVFDVDSSSELLTGRDLAFLVMPYIAGKTLADKIEQNGHLTLDETLLYMEQITDALAVAHAEGVVHRDLKPANFLLKDEGNLLVADFGIAHLEGSTLTEVGEFIGTRGYAAPEVTDCKEIDARADIYSLGIILYEMLMGYQLVPSEVADGDLPADVMAVFRKATASNPRDRYASVQEFARALKVAAYSDATRRASKSGEQDNASFPRRRVPQVEEITPSEILPSRKVRVDPPFLLQDRPPRHARLIHPANLDQRSPLLKPRRRGQLPGSKRQAQPHALKHRRLSPEYMLHGLQQTFSGISRMESVRRIRRRVTSRQLLGGIFFGIVLLGALVWIAVTLLSHSSADVAAVNGGTYPVSVGGGANTGTTSLSLTLAQQTVQRYYDDWNKKDYTGAYALLDSSYQKSNPYTALLSDYQHTHFVCLQIDDAVAQSDGSVKVSITDNAIEDNMGNVSQQVVNLYTGYYIVRSQSSGPTIEPHLAIVSGESGSCTMPK